MFVNNSVLLFFEYYTINNIIIIIVYKITHIQGKLLLFSDK